MKNSTTTTISAAAPRCDESAGWGRARIRRLPSGWASALDHVVAQTRVALCATAHRRVVHGSAFDDDGDVAHRLRGTGSRAVLEARKVDVARVQPDLELGHTQRCAVRQGLPVAAGIHLDHAVLQPEARTLGGVGDDAVLGAARVGELDTRG